MGNFFLRIRRAASAKKKAVMAKNFDIILSRHIASAKKKCSTAEQVVEYLCSTYPQRYGGREVERIRQILGISSKIDGDSGGQDDADTPKEEMNSGGDDDTPKEEMNSGGGDDTPKEENGGQDDADTPKEENGGHETKFPLFKDLGGMRDVIKRVELQLSSLFYTPLRGTPKLPQGLLLHGRRGSGKTMLACAIGNEAGLPFYNVSATEFMYDVSGESALGNIRDLFLKANRTAPCVIFIDEIDKIAKKWDVLQRQVDRHILSALKLCFDELQHNVLVIGATNQIDSMDPGLRTGGRFGEEILLDVPDESGRAEILSLLTRNMKLENINLENIARLTPELVGGDLAAITRRADLYARDRFIDKKKAELSVQHYTLSQEEATDIRITIADFVEAARTVYAFLEDI